MKVTLMILIHLLFLMKIFFILVDSTKQYSKETFQIQV
jgi:hypothetical protein